jgi:hypothetical protein
MSTTNCDCPCPDPTVVEVPGVQGDAGADGADGADGTNVWTLTTANFDVANAVDTIDISVADNTAYVVGQTVFIRDPTPGTDHGTFEVISLTGTTAMGVRYMGATGDTAAPFTIGSGGKVTATGDPAALAAALPTALTDNSTGTASDTIAAGAGVTTLAFAIDLTTLGVGASELMTDYTPGYAFKILAVDFVVTDVGAGAGASMTINLEIGVTNVTGGELNPTLANTATAGAIVAGTAVTANNTGTDASTLSIEVAAGGTVFTSGTGIILVKVQNMDTANAIASLAEHINDLITSLSLLP